MQNLRTKIIGVLPGGLDLKLSWYQFGQGPKFVINCGTHGGEITYWIAKKVYQELKDQKINFEVIIVPHANPVAWLQRVYSKTLGKFNFDDGKDWNRDFPGSLDGSLAQIISANLSEIFKDAKYLVDLHTSRDSLPFSICSDLETLNIAKAMGLDMHYLMDGFTGPGHDYTKTMAGAFGTRGTTALTLECGSHDMHDQKIIDDISKGIISYITGQKTQIQDGFIFKKLKTVRSPHSGFVEFKKLPGDYAKAGETLAVVHAAETFDKDFEVKISSDCRIIKKLPSHIAWLGDELFQVAECY